MLGPTSSAPTIAITGAGGFIGSHLVQLALAEGCRVRALLHYNALGSVSHLAEVIDGAKSGGESWHEEGRLEIVHGDILDERCTRELIRGCDQVFHLAALIGIPYSYRSPGSYVRVNTLGTLNVLEACREEKPERLIVTSTSEVYGSAREVPIDESHPLRAQSPYSASKIAADKLAESYHLSFGLPVVTLRPFNTYGPRQSARALVAAVLAQALSAERREIRLGSLDPIRDLTYVEDTAAGYMALSRAPLGKVAGRVYNLGSGSGKTVEEIARLAAAAAGGDGAGKPIVSDAERVRPESSEVDRLVADATRLQSDVGWKPRVSLDEGLARTVQWMTPRMNLYDPRRYRI